MERQRGSGQRVRMRQLSQKRCKTRVERQWQAVRRVARHVQHMQGYASLAAGPPAMQGHEGERGCASQPRRYFLPAGRCSPSTPCFSCMRRSSASCSFRLSFPLCRVAL